MTVLLIQERLKVKKKKVGTSYKDLKRIKCKSLLGFWSKKVKTWTSSIWNTALFKSVFQIKERDDIAPWERKMFKFVREVDWLTVLNKEISRKRREM